MTGAEQIRAKYQSSSVEVVAELIALSVVEHSYSPDIMITVELDGASGTIVDTGRGMQLQPDHSDTITHAERALTSIYPITAARSDVNTALTELVWGTRGCLGPALANASCRQLEFVSSRNGVAWTQRFQRGEPQGPAVAWGRSTSMARR